MKHTFQLLDYIDLLPKKVRIALYIMSVVIIILLGLVGYLCTVIYLQNGYIDWINYIIDKGLFVY